MSRGLKPKNLSRAPQYPPPRHCHVLQMTILLARWWFLLDDEPMKPVSLVADMLLAMHFALDPYLYVLQHWTLVKSICLRRAGRRNNGRNGVGGGGGSGGGGDVAAWAVKEVLITVAKDFARYIRSSGGGAWVSLARPVPLHTRPIDSSPDRRHTVVRSAPVLGGGHIDRKTSATVVQPVPLVRRWGGGLARKFFSKFRKIFDLYPAGQPRRQTTVPEFTTTRRRIDVFRSVGRK